MRVIASIEARMGSSRFYGKVLSDIHGQPALKRLVCRLKDCKLLNGIVIATTDRPSDDVLEHWANSECLPVFRGSENDVLKRVVDAHQEMKSDVVVELTGDNILVDPVIIDMAIRRFMDNGCDILTTGRIRQLPLGMDVVVFRAEDLEGIEKKTNDPADREHVALYFFDHPESYRILDMVIPESWRMPECRLTLDYPEDQALLTEIYKHLEPEYGNNFGIEAILGLFSREANLKTINMHCIQKPPR